ncbi:spindle pole body interacting protein [Sistotremastrum niveocremeum HHB9708]|uniref:Spindle pole body interacting protein n=2 Tax=Sistotremastraceae TaxID=3402574 RepID=A0A164XSN1_9AGAM|nr:spindle pole body interacting protein [Sistotremastrum niveocremeum HHB9708]KZT34773.1 spindle pole body interacting protein [Sistotremastrum suecicum HHB10207 ss-3]
MAQNVSFVLLAEFDIDVGAILSRQFPTPLGTDEQLLASLMLPDGAEKQSEDWTIFLLNQTPLNTVDPLFSDSPERDSFDRRSSTDDTRDMLYVLNLVRTKHDTSVRRGAIVKAMAICTHYPFIQIFKPVLLMALDDYFSDPTIECLERLYDSINAMDLSRAPQLSRSEKLIMRVSERKDVFIEKFATPRLGSNVDLRAISSQSSLNHESGSEEALAVRSRTTSMTSSASESSTSGDGGSAVWMGEDHRRPDIRDLRRGRSPELPPKRTPGVNGWRESRFFTHKERPSSNDSHARHIPPIKDTHYYETSISFKNITLPIRLPLFTFDDEIGEYSMIRLIQTFSTPGATVIGPLHPHLHTNGILTHPIILLFNALVTAKRIIFLGYGKPAGLVADFVLAACALGSGCGCVLRGFPERVFPYANLLSKDIFESVSGFIAGVTNPVFEQAGKWDVLCNIETGRILVNRDIQTPSLPANFPSPPAFFSRPGSTLKPEGSLSSDEDFGKAPGQTPSIASVQRNDFAAKADNADNVFMEDIMAAISLHYGETMIRARFTEYLQRFVRLASRYEEDTMGSTSIGFPSQPYTESEPGEFGLLGTGLVFLDDLAGARELQMNASRIEGWRRTRSYDYYRKDFRAYLETNAIQGFDLAHQIGRLRNAKNMADGEMDLIVRTLVERVRSYEQVVEVLSHFPPHAGGLLPLTFGLFHQQEPIRDIVVEVLDTFRSYPIGYQFLQSLNAFHRYAYVRQAHARQERMAMSIGSIGANNGIGTHNLFPPPWTGNTQQVRTPSNRSETSLGAG